jgi:glucose-6-phosphate isomerase
VFIQGVVWDIDSSDQWGVAPGKVLAVMIVPELASAAGSALEHGWSAGALIGRYCALEDR